MTAPVFATLVAIVICCAGYVHAERSDGRAAPVGGVLGVKGQHSLSVQSILWSCAYVICQSVDCVYIKHVVSTVAMTSWGRSYYNNVLAMGPLMVAWSLNTRHTEVDLLIEKQAFGLEALLAVALSCALGVCLSVSAFHCRRQLDATSYSVLGNMNKVLAVLINCSI